MASSQRATGCGWRCASARKASAGSLAPVAAGAPPPIGAAASLASSCCRSLSDFSTRSIGAAPLPVPTRSRSCW